MKYLLIKVDNASLGSNILFIINISRTTNQCPIDHRQNPVGKRSVIDQLAIFEVTCCCCYCCSQMNRKSLLGDRHTVFKVKETDR